MAGCGAAAEAVPATGAVSGAGRSTTKDEEMSHTEGPWYCDESDGNVEICTDGKEPRLGYTGWRGLAVVSGSDDEPEIGLEVAWDNARLIAAAPELLEALQGLHDDIAEYQRINHIGGYENHSMRIARAAIEKATKP